MRGFLFSTAVDRPLTTEEKRHVEPKVSFRIRKTYLLLRSTSAVGNTRQWREQRKESSDDICFVCFAISYEICFTKFYFNF